MSQLYSVTWKAGSIQVHASTEKEAREIAIEYMRAHNVIQAQPDLKGTPCPSTAL